MDNHEDPLFDWIRDSLARGEDPSAMTDEADARFGTDCAILVMDSAGFTRTTRHQGILPYLTSLVRARDVVLPVLLRHDGHAVQAEADNFMARFDAVDQAYHAARAAMEALRQAAIPLMGEETFQVCAGIGYGRCLASAQEGVFGDQMNLASKLGEDTAEPGEILLTEAAFIRLGSGHAAEFTNQEVHISGTRIVYHRTLVGAPE